MLVTVWGVTLDAAPLSFRVHMPKKPIRHGIMIKAACCAKSGCVVLDYVRACLAIPSHACYCLRLLCDFVVQDYTKHDKRKPGFSTSRPFAASNVALFQYFYSSLKRRKDLSYLWVADSGYTSVKLARWAVQANQRFIGALKGNSSGIKADMLPKKSKKTPVGTAQCFRSNDGLLLFQGWLDRGQLNNLSTECTGCNGNDGHYYGGSSATAMRRRTNADGAWVREEVSVPEASAVYQAHYQKVDCHDKVRIRRLWRLCFVLMFFCVCSFVLSSPQSVLHIVGTFAYGAGRLIA